MVKPIELFACEICEKRYLSYEDAQTCEARGVSPAIPDSDIDVGDFVTMKGRSWALGVKSPWCIDRGVPGVDFEPRSHLDLRFKYIFLVVGRGPLPDQKHEEVIHIWTPRHAHYLKSGPCCGWTRSTGYICLERVDPALITDDMRAEAAAYDGPREFAVLL